MTLAETDTEANPCSLRYRLVFCGAPATVSEDGRTQALSVPDAALLAYLALEGPTSRQRMLALLWPDESPDLVRNRLRQRLFTLKRKLGVEAVEGTLTLSLAPSLHWPGFEHEPADRPFLGTADPVELPGFGEWIDGVRDRLQVQRREQLAGSASALEQQGRLAEAIVAAEQLLALEPCQEHAHRRLMRLHYLRGDRAAALQAFDRCEQVLKDEVGAMPSAETLELLAQIDRAGPPAVSVARRALPVSLRRPPRLIGRDAEWAELQAAWDRHEAIVILGEAGMGKTRLLADLVQARGGLVATARPGDERVPFALWSRLLRALLDRRSEPLAPGVQSELGRLLPELPQVAEAAGVAVANRARFVGAIEATLQSAAEAGLQAVALDDLHFADAASLELAQHLSGTAGLRWLMACRPGELSAPAQALVDTLIASRHANPLTLRPLDGQQVVELMDSLQVSVPDAPALALALHQRTGGNPLFLLETLRALLQSGAALDAAALSQLPAGGSVGRLIERRLGQLSPQALNLARCAAIAGTEFSAALATEVMKTPSIALADAWAELESAGLLREQAFAHDLAHEATLATVPRAIARQLHGEVATFLETQGRAPPATLARHWLSAGQPQKAIAHLQRAAEAAERAYDVAEASRLWSQLCELHQAAGDHDTAFDAAFSAAAALRLHTTGDAMDAATQRLHSLARTARQRGAAWRQQAELALMRGHNAQAESMIRQGLDALGSEGLASDRASLLNALGVLQRRQGQLVAAAATMRECVELARSRPPSEMDLASNLNNLGLVLQDLDRPLEAVALLQESAERQRDPSTRARVLNNLANTLEEVGQAPLALEQRLAAARAVAGSRSAVEWVVSLQLGNTARVLCRWRDALSHLQHAEELGTQQQHHLKGDIRRHRAAIWLQLGRLNLAREELAAIDVAPLDRFNSAMLELMRARLSMALHRPDEARSRLEQASASMAQLGNLRGVRRIAVALAEVLPPADSLALVEQALASPEVSGNPCALLSMQLRAAQALRVLNRPDAALAAARRAASLLSAVWPMDITPAEVWLTLAEAAEACADGATAHDARLRGRAFIEQIAQDQLDACFREGWLGLNPVNARLAAQAVPASRRG